MKFDLCIGDGEIFWEFADVADREKVWGDLTSSYGWQPEWAEKRGDGSGARCHIVIHASKMPVTYRWKCAFER